jgi:hypothetical protein
LTFRADLESIETCGFEDIEVARVRQSMLDFSSKDATSFNLDLFTQCSKYVQYLEGVLILFQIARVQSVIHVTPGRVVAVQRIPNVSAPP